MSETPDEGRKKMSLKIAVIMDPIEHIKIHKDSTFAMLLEAQRRGHQIYYLLTSDLYVFDGVAKAITSKLEVKDNPQSWFTTSHQQEIYLSEFDAILMRKDPPFDMEYIYCTYALDLAKAAGALVINDPAALRNFNEKFSISNFPECCVPTVITASLQKIEEFIQAHRHVVVKPLDGMGGESIFKITQGDANKNAILEQITQHGRKTILAQAFIPDVEKGDKRILLVNGEPVPYALARIPKQGEFRSNLAVGGTGEGIALTERDLWICEQLKPHLINNGILFAGIDVIGSYLTEINITSPTCIRELDQQYDLNISSQLFDCIEHLKH